LRLPNRESGPQNQPTAKVATSVFAGAAASMGGLVAFGIERVIAVSIPLLLLDAVPSQAWSITPNPRPVIAIPAGKIQLNIFIG
jgi:hypothetical protein